MTVLFLEANMSNDDDWYLLIGLFQFIIGAIQIIGAIFRTIISLFDKTDRQKLGIYWAMVLVYFSVWELFLYNHWNIIIWIPFAWLIAIWYCIKIVLPKEDSVSISIDNN
jgi:hypothetical protein